MKNTLTLFMVGLAVAAMAATTSLNWESTNLNLNEVKVNEQVDLAFTFTNEGVSSVTILEAKGSCGCTQVSYSEETIEPGASAQVTAKFRASKEGTFHKTIKVKTSDKEEYTVLSFTGTAVK